MACPDNYPLHIKRKMSSLFIAEKVQTEYLIDIFDDRSSKGLIDSDSASDFDARLMSLRSSWDERKSNTVGKKPPNFTVTS